MGDHEFPAASGWAILDRTISNSSREIFIRPDCFLDCRQRVNARQYSEAQVKSNLAAPPNINFKQTPSAFPVLAVLRQACPLKKQRVSHMQTIGAVLSIGIPTDIFTVPDNAGRLVNASPVTTPRPQTKFDILVIGGMKQPVKSTQL
ncbi:MAG: hypothetical protein WDM80_10095 [Limisphaerales bacterium]